VLTHGLSWDYCNAALFTRIYWTSLLFIDPFTALLLLVSPVIGLILCIAVIVTDVAHNSWFALHHPIRMDLYLSQIVFLLFVAFTVRTAWRGAASRCAAPHVIG
jgi:xanthine/uracil permease